MLNRRALLAGAGGLLSASLVGVAEAKPRDCVPPKYLRCGNPTASPSPTVAPPGSTGWPDATNTPSVSGSTLTYYPNYPTDSTPSTVSLTTVSGTITLNTPGTIYENKDLTGAIDVTAANCIIRRCRIRALDPGDIVCVINNSGGALTIEDCILDGGERNMTAVMGDRYTVKRCNVHSCENGFDVPFDVVIQDCYVHDLYNGGVDAHADCIQLNNAANNVTISHNTLFCVDKFNALGTACVISADFAEGGASNVLIQNNRLGGGSVCIYGVQGGPGTNYQIIGNRWTTQFAALGGNSGPWTECADETLSDNRWLDGPNAGQLITPA